MDLAALHTAQGFATTALALVSELGVFQLLGTTLHTPTEAECLLLLKAKLYLSRDLDVAQVQAADMLALERNSNDIRMLLLLFSHIFGTNETSLFKEQLIFSCACLSVACLLQTCRRKPLSMVLFHSSNFKAELLCLRTMPEFVELSDTDSNKTCRGQRRLTQTFKCKLLMLAWA